MKEEVLMKVGLSSNEIKVYLALTELGPSKASSIVRKSGVHRANVYDAIERLGERGLIRLSVKENVNRYETEHPRRLLEILEDKEDDISETKREVEDILPELTSLAKISRKEDQKIALFRGKTGLKTVLEDVLKNAKPNDFYIIGYSGIGRKTLGVYHQHWDERRVKLGIIRKALASEENRDFLFKSPLTNVRYLPGEYTSDASTTIYGDKIVIHLMEDKKPLAVMVISESLARVYKNYFKLLWSISKK